MPPPTEHEFEAACFDKWADTGDPQDLLVLADWIYEYQTEREHFTTLLREVAAAANPAVNWFYKHGPTSYNPKFETERHGRLREAACLAWCEANLFAKVDAKLWQCRWERDFFDADGEDYAPVNPWLWRVWLYENAYPNLLSVQDDQRWKMFNALGAVELEPVELFDRTGKPLVSSALTLAYAGRYGFPMFDMDGNVNSKDVYSPYSRVLQAVLCGPKTEILEWMKPQRDPPASEIVVFRDYQGVTIGLLPEVPSCVERSTDLCIAYQAIRDKSVYRLRECDVPYEEVVRLSKKPTAKDRHAIAAVTGLLMTERGIRAVPKDAAPKNAAKKRAERRAELFKQ